MPTQASKSSTMQYAGFHPPNSGWSLPVIDPVNMQADQFYAEFVAARRPCVFSSWPQDFPPFTADHLAQLLSLKQPEASDNLTLKMELAERRVQVEEVGQGGHFGTAKQRKVTTFGDFVTKDLPTGRYYLTTQYEDNSDNSKSAKSAGEDKVEAEPVVFQAPLDVLVRASVLPSTIRLMGHLEVQQANLWLGSTAKSNKSTSSGLHHDFHDNIYLLAAGRKTFHLFSPRDTPHVYLHGSVRGVFKNGLIHYHGVPKVQEDGRFVIDALKERERQLEIRLKAFSAGDTSEDYRAAQTELDTCVEEILELELEEGCANGEGEEDFESDEEEDESDASNADPWKPNKRQRQSMAECNASKNNEDPLYPPSFSSIPPGTIGGKVSGFKYFPALAKAIRITVELEAGQALYLPASWFHEVVSTSVNSAESSVHAAVNFWYAPPVFGAAFEHPYHMD